MPELSLTLLLLFLETRTEPEPNPRHAGVPGSAAVTEALSVQTTPVREFNANQHVHFASCPKDKPVWWYKTTDLRKRLVFFLTVTVNPLPGWWIRKKIIATFCDDLTLLWIFPLSQKSTYLWEVGRGWSKELGNFSPLSIQPSNTYRGSIYENKAFAYCSVSWEQKHEVLQTLLFWHQMACSKSVIKNKNSVYWSIS